MSAGAFRLKPTQCLLCCFFFLLFSNDPVMAGQAISVDMFQIKRNKNRNLEQYAIYLDGQSCQPQNTESAHVFWRDLEIGPDVTNKIKWYEKPAYGISSQALKEGELHMRLKALPGKLISVHFGKSGGGCRVTAYTTINGLYSKKFTYMQKKGLSGPP